MNAQAQIFAPGFRPRLRREKYGRAARHRVQRPLIHHNDFYARVLSKSPLPELVSPEKGAPQALRSSGWGCRVIKAAKAKNDIFAITVNEERSWGSCPLIWNAAQRNGKKES